MPTRYGDFSAICRNFLPDDYRREAGPHRVLRDIAIESEWDARNAFGDALWIDALAREAGTPHAMAAQAWLDRDDLDELLALYASGCWALQHASSGRSTPSLPSYGSQGQPGNAAHVALDAKWRVLATSV